ncbi:MAG: PAS domain S-box protein [Candidatus Bathyarchaeia archaeon]
MSSEKLDRDYEGKLLALHHHAQQLATATTMDEIMNHTLDAMELSLGFSSADFSIVDAGKRCLHLRGRRGSSPSFSELPLDGPGISVKTANTGKTILIVDARGEDAYVDDEGRAGKEATPVKLSELAVPVILDDAVVVVLNVESDRPSAFTNVDQRLLETLASHVASSLGRLQREEKLRESEEKYRSLFDRMLDGVYRSTREGRFVDVNPAFVKMFGYSSKQEMLNIIDIKRELYFSPEERGSHILDKGQEQVQAYRMRRKDGSEIWVEDHGGYVHDEQGNIIYHEGILRDISERAHMEKVLQESEMKYRAIVENSPNMIGIFQDGVLKYVNNVAVLKLGWTFEELVSPSFDPIENVVSQKFRSLLKENIGKRLRGEDVAPYEISLTRKDGSEVPVLVRGAKIIYSKKPAIEFAFNDIAERKRMEEELSRSSQFLGSVVENAYVWLDVLDNEQNVLVWNKAAEVTSGYSREEVLGHGKVWEWLYPDQEYRKQTIETVNDVLQSGRTDVDSETRIKRKDGQTRIISWNERALTDQDGKTIGTIAIGHDITERKRMEEEIRNLARFPSENPNPVLRLKKDGVILVANPASKLLLQEWGSEVGQVAPKFWRDLVTDLLSTGQSKNLDIESGGKSYTFLVKPIVESEYVNLYGRDITERKKMRDELKVSEARYRTLFEKSPIGIHLSTFDGKVISMNEAMQAVAGYSIEELQKISIAEMYESSDERKTMLEMLERYDTLVNYQARLVRKDGTSFDALLNISRVRFGDQDLVQTACLDITERQRMEARLRFLHEHTLQLSSAQTLDEIVKYTLFAMKFSVGSDFCDFNLVEGDLLVCKGSTATGKLPPVQNNGLGIIAKTAREKVTLRIGDTSKEPTYLDRNRPKWTGPPTMLSELATPVLVKNQVVAVLNVEKAQPNSFTEQDQEILETLASHVASALHRLSQEEKLREHSEHLEELVQVRTKELRSAERMATIGELATMVAHDLRNPLQGIATATYNLKKHTGKRIDRVSKEMYEIIEQDIKHSDRIVGDLLDFSKEVHLDMKETDAQATTKSALAHVKIPKRIRVVNSTKSLPKMMADAEKMRRVLINLIENAIDAMPKRGKLTIESRESDGGVEISLSDNGTGMSKETLERIWSPLFTTKAKGIGLGLPIAKRLVEAQGGSITVQSKQGTRTTFTIRIPKAPTKNKERA